MYWAEESAEPAASRTQRLVDAASAAAEQNADAAGKMLRRALRLSLPQVPPEDQFRTRCLTFAQSVLLEAAGDKQSAVRILEEHCQEKRSGLQVGPVERSEQAKCRKFADLFISAPEWQADTALEAWCQAIYHSHSPALLGIRRVFFREVLLGAPHGTALLEAELRCAPHVISTTAGRMGGTEVVRVVYDDPPGLNRFRELLDAYAAHGGPVCPSPACRRAVFCTTKAQCEAADGAECARIYGPFEPAPASAQAAEDPTCDEPAPNSVLHGGYGPDSTAAC